MKLDKQSYIRILAIGDPASELYRSNGPLTGSWTEKTGIKVDVDIRPWAEYADLVFAELASGRGTCDVVMLPGFFWLPSMASKGYLSPLEDLLPRAEEAWKAFDFEDIPLSLRKELFFKNTHFLIPAFAEVQTVVYRQDLLEAAGVPPLQRPVPMDRYIETAETLHSPPTVYGTLLKGGPAESFPEWLPFLSAAGGGLFGPDERPVFDSAAGRESLRMMCSLREVSAPGVETADNEAVNSLIRSGKVGIVNHWSGQLGPLSVQAAGRYGYTYLEHPWGTVWSFGITSASRNKEAALAYLLYAANPANDILQGDLSGSPVRNATYRTNRHPWYRTVAEALERKNSFPSFVRFGDLAGHLYSMVTEVLAGGVEPRRALRQAAEATSP